MAKARQSKAGKVRPDLAEKRLKALNLRKAGASFDSIARACGYKSPASAYRAVRAAIADTLREPAEEVLTLELERLDRLMVAWWATATGGDGAKNGDAADRVLRIIRQRCDLLGLHVVAIKRAESIEDASPLPANVAEAMIRAGLDELQKGDP